MPHLPALKAEAQTFKIAALVAADRGDNKQALSSLEDIIRLADLLAREPFSISQLVRAACLQMALSGAEDLLSRQALSIAELGRLRNSIESIQPRKMLTRTLAGERVVILSTVSPSEAPLAPFEANADENPQTAARNYRFGMKILAAIGFTIGDRRLMLETMAKLIALAEDDSPKAFRRAKAVDDGLAEKLRGFPPKMFARLMLPAVSKIIERFVSLEAHKRAALVALTVEQYRVEHAGALPDRLSAVSPQFPAGFPRDPFDGEPLRYRHLTNGYVVYSVGPDLHDDGGDKRTRPRGGKYLDETFRVLR